MCWRRTSAWTAFAGLPVQERLDREGTEAGCEVFVVDLESGRLADSVVLQGAGPELHDVAAVVDTRSATAVSVEGDDLERQRGGEQG